MSCILVDVKAFVAPPSLSASDNRPQLEPAALSLLRTAEAIRSALSRTLQPHGITPQQFDVLRILSEAGEHGLPTSSIAGQMVERSPGITRLLDRMEKRQWIWRHRCHNDRRVVYVGISPAGAEMLTRLDGPLHQNFLRVATALTSAQHEQLRQSLTAICREMQPEPSKAKHIAAGSK